MNKYKDLNYDFNKIKILDLSKYDNIFITGGEPGLLSKKDKDNLYNYLISNYSTAQIELFTNGTNIDEWNNNLYKLIHLLENNTEDENKKLLKYKENSSYTIVLTQNSNIDKITNLVSLYKRENCNINIKNDSLNPLDIQVFNDILIQLGLTDIIQENKQVSRISNSNSLKIETDTTCTDLPNYDNTLHRKMSIHKKCLCDWYNCLT